MDFPLSFPRRNMRPLALRLFACIAFTAPGSYALAQPAQAEPAPSEEPEEMPPGPSKPPPPPSEQTIKAAPSPASDVVVVPRKAVLKSGRLELAPFTGLTIND